MKKLYDSNDLKKKENRTPHYHVTWGGVIIAFVFGVIVFFLAKVI